MKINLNAEDKEILKPIAQSEARDFLHTQLDAVEKRINKRRARQVHFYEGEALPEEEISMLSVLEQERNLIQELMQASDEALFVDAMRQRITQRQRRESSLIGRSISDLATRTERWRLKNEGNILAELQRQWLHWLKKQ
jgi:hypothetical protein